MDLENCAFTHPNVSEFNTSSSSNQEEDFFSRLKETFHEIPLNLHPPHQKPNIKEKEDSKEEDKQEEARQEKEEGRKYIMKIFPNVFKSTRQIKWQLRLEWLLLKKEYAWIVGMIIMEYFHLAARNLVYYIQGRVYGRHGHVPPPPLKDLGFMLFGSNGDNNHLLLSLSLQWLITLFIAMLGILMILLWIVRVLLNVAWGGPEIAINGRDINRPVLKVPMPLVLIVKRISQAGISVIPLRCITFLTTLLPPPAPHCQESESWLPPTSANNIFNPFSSPQKGCGDQMFSGHILHGTIVVAMILRYYPRLYSVSIFSIVDLFALALIMVMFQSHYTADILAALYITMGVWFLLPQEPSNLDKYCIKANVFVGPDYMSITESGTVPWRRTEIIVEEADEEEAKEERKSCIDNFFRVCQHNNWNDEDVEVSGRCTDCFRIWRRNTEVVHHEDHKTMAYLSPPPSSNNLKGHQNLILSEYAVERLPW